MEAKEESRMQLNIVSVPERVVDGDVDAVLQKGYVYFAATQKSLRLQVQCKASACLVNFTPQDTSSSLAVCGIATEVSLKTDTIRHRQAGE